ncbi:MAG TPA: helix-turn-helix domain-containing protein [Candidatus Nanoarchaeia archaeon]|nr:helix-turn-helix domain-containing protein [Candidatus Nanoarchaeia archaeon]
MSLPIDLVDRVASEYKKNLQRESSESDGVFSIPTGSLDGLCQTHRIGHRTLVHVLAEARNRETLTESQLEPLVVKREENSFPTKSQERFETALKTTSMERRIVAMLLLDEGWKTPHELRAKLIELVGSDAPVPRGPTMVSYYEHVLYESGFVAKIRLGKGLGLNQLYVTLTKDGKEIGQPLHYHALRQVVGFNQSVRQFGFANDSSGHSGVYNRFRLLRRLEQAFNRKPTDDRERMEQLIREAEKKGPPGVRIAALASYLGIQRESVEAHLRQLQRQGYVTLSDRIASWTGPKSDFMLSYAHAIHRFLTEPEVRYDVRGNMHSERLKLPTRLRVALEISEQYTCQHDPLPFDKWRNQMLNYLRIHMNGHQGLPRTQVIYAIQGLPHTNSQRLDRLIQTGDVVKMAIPKNGHRLVYYRPADVTI